MKANNILLLLLVILINQESCFSSSCLHMQGFHKRMLTYVKFEGFTAVPMKNAVFWDVMALVRTRVQSNISPPSSGWW
jgi:hypothetical protein